MLPVGVPTSIAALASQWPILAAATARLAEITLAVPAEAVSAFRAVIDSGDDDLKARFVANEPVEDLVRARARLIDLVLTRAWSLHLTGHTHGLALLAVGG